MGKVAPEQRQHARAPSDTARPRAGLQVTNIQEFTIQHDDFTETSYKSLFSRYFSRYSSDMISQRNSPKNYGQIQKMNTAAEAWLMPCLTGRLSQPEAQGK